MNSSPPQPAPGTEDDNLTAAALQTSIDKFHHLPLEERNRFEQHCQQTRAARAAAAASLSDALDGAGITSAELRERMPQSAALIDTVLSHTAPLSGFSSAQRTAIVDAFVAVVFKDLAFSAGQNLFRTLTGPAEEAIGALG